MDPTYVSLAVIILLGVVIVDLSWSARKLMRAKALREESHAIALLTGPGTGIKASSDAVLAADRIAQKLGR